MSIQKVEEEIEKAVSKISIDDWREIFEKQGLGYLISSVPSNKDVLIFRQGDRYAHYSFKTLLNVNKRNEPICVQKIK